MKRIKFAVVVFCVMLMMTACKKYAPLYQNFSEFHRLIITDQGNWDEELSDENGNIYFRLKEENYQNTEDVKELLENTFSAGYIETNLQWVLEGLEIL